MGATGQRADVNPPKPKSAPKAAPEAPKATGIAANLSPEKQARLAALQKQLADKIRNQTSSGIDPAYITMGAEIVALYVEGGARGFGNIMRDFMAATGLSARDAQPAMRAAYTHVRDEMELNGEDTTGFDDHQAVMAEVRKAMAEEDAAQAETEPSAPDEPAAAPEPATATTEAGAEGLPQSVIPGAERSQEQAQQASRDRAELEMRARQQQSKMGRLGGNSGDAGPLFDTQGDMFSNVPNAPAASPAATAAAPQTAAPEAEPETEAETDAQPETGADTTPTAKPEDLSREAGIAAYRNTRFNPERRADSDIASYVQDVNELRDEMAKLATTPEQQEILAREIERYRDNYLRHQNAMWGSQSRTASAMITGPANFPTAQNRKRMETAHKRSAEFLDWHAKARTAMRRAIMGAQSDADKMADEWAGIEADLLDRIKRPDSSRALIKGIVERLAQRGEVELVQRSLELFRTGQERFGLSKPVFTARAEVWGLEALAQSVAAKKAKAAEAGPRTLSTYEGAEISDHPADDRIRIVFDDRVSRDIAADLKGEGWRWSPTNTAWQRKRTNAAIQSARRIVGKHFTAAPATAAPAATAAAQADPNPTEAQKEAGNYRKGHMAWNGLDLSIENAKGSTRSGTDSKGNEWSVTMPAHYGYFKGTEGADGDHVDFYMGDVERSDYVLIVDQVHADTGKFDEHKVIIGTTARGAALGIYRDGFSDGRGDDRIGAITETTVETLKAWLAGGQLRRPVAGTLNWPFKKEKPQRDAAPDPAPEVAPEVAAYATTADWSNAVLDAVRARLREGRSVKIGVTSARTAMVTSVDQLNDFLRTGPDGSLQIRSGNNWLAYGISEAYRLAAEYGIPARFEAVPQAERAETLSVADQIDAIADDRDMDISDEQRGQIIAGQRDGETVEAAFDRILAPSQEAGAAQGGNALLQQGREMLQPYGQDNDGPFDLSSGQDLRDTPEGIALADALAATGDVTARQKISDDWVREQGRRAGIEFLVGLDKDGLPLAIMSGARSSVSMHAAVYRAAANGVLDYLTHNHPMNGGFSGSDVAMAHLGIRRVVAIRHNGSRHQMDLATDHRTREIYQGPTQLNLPSVEQLKNDTFEPIFSRVRGEVNTAALALPGGPTAQREAFVTAMWYMYGLVLDRLGVINYLGGTVADVSAEGFNFEDIYGQVSSFGRDRLRRAGFNLAKGRNSQRDPAPATEPRSQAPGRAGADRQAATDGGGSNGTGRVSAQAVTPGASGKIEDFGQKLGGARKDTWMAYADKMADAENVDIAAEPLSKSWPAPDYEKLIEGGVEPWKVDLIRVTRNAIPTKPQSSWKLKGWVANVTQLRDFANKIMDGRYERADIRRVLGADSGIMGALDLYAEFGHGQSLKGLHLAGNSYSMYRGVRYSPNRVIWEVTMRQKAAAFSNMPRTLASGDTKEEALAAFKKIYDSLGQTKEQATKTPKFLIYKLQGGAYYSVGVKIGSNYVELRRVETVAEARRVVAEDAAALTDQLKRMKEVPRERRDENAPRVGVDHRNGTDVTAEQFGDTFGFRGVEFGNWVEGKRRQQDLNNAYDALLDMAGILDIPPKAISLNGTLGLAFGARGGGGGKMPAAAHYEPGKVVINLTKTQGAGSLAHEWFHAIDNHMAKRVVSRMGASCGRA